MFMHKNEFMMYIFKVQSLVLLAHKWFLNYIEIRMGTFWVVILYHKIYHFKMSWQNDIFFFKHVTEHVNEQLLSE